MTLIPSVNGQFFANISTQEACTVTQKLDLDQISERSICILKDTNITLSFVFFSSSFSPRFVWPTLDDSSDICEIKWRQKWPRNFRPPSDPILFSSQHLKTVWRRLLTAVRCEWWNGATGFAIPVSVFDPLPTSAFGKARSTNDEWCSSGYTDDFFPPLFFFLIKKIGPCLSLYAWSEGTPIIISAWYTSDVFPVSSLWTGKRKWHGAVFIQLKIK